jgi:hypothetical protein
MHSADVRCGAASVARRLNEGTMRGVGVRRVALGPAQRARCGPVAAAVARKPT